MADKQKKVRVQIDVSEPRYERLVRLRDETDAASIAECIRDSVDLSINVDQLRTDGYEILAIHPATGKQVVLYLPKRS